MLKLIEFAISALSFWTNDSADCSVFITTPTVIDSKMTADFVTYFAAFSRENLAVFRDKDWAAEKWFSADCKDSAPEDFIDSVLLGNTADLAGFEDSGSDDSLIADPDCEVMIEAEALDSATLIAQRQIATARIQRLTRLKENHPEKER